MFGLNFAASRAVRGIARAPSALVENGPRDVHGRTPAAEVTSASDAPTSNSEGSLRHRGGKFRRDIEGLRAVAVILVVLYHAGVPWLAGGYVGVDVFFVISGFLITGLLATELDRTSRISLRDFYARRLRRLLPAAVVVLVVTLVAAKVLLAPLLLPDIATDARAAAAYVSNIWFAHKGTDYLANHSPSPIQHYWSLGVEEQFYLAWPLLLAVVSWRARNRAARLFVAVATVTGLSLALCVVATRARPSQAFFSLPTRAWELGVGGLLALSLPALKRLPATWARVASWVGLLLIAVAAVRYNETVAFPGWFALVPVLGAAAVIAAGTNHRAGGASVMLDTAPFQFLGRISYSLYLWHWPLIVVPAMAWGPELSPWSRAALVLAAVVLAHVTYKLVESPARAQPWLVAHRGAVFSGAAALTALALLLTVVAARLPRLDSGRDAVALSSADLVRDIPAPEFVPANLVTSLASAASDIPTIYRDGCHADLPDIRAKGCSYGPATGARTVALVGDSHAAQWFPAVRTMAEQNGWRLLTLTKSACPAVDVPVLNATAAYPECNAWRQDVFRRIAEQHVDLVILADFSASYQTKLAVGGAFLDAWKGGLQRTLAELPTAAHVVVLSDTPTWPTPPNLCLSEHLDNPSVCSRPRTDLFDEQLSATERSVTVAAGGQFIDTTSWICSDRCQAIAGTFLMYRDADHMTATFAAALAPQLAVSTGAATP